MLVHTCGQVWFLLLMYRMVCDGSIFGDTVKLIVFRKGTIRWYVNTTPGSRTPKYDKGESPLQNITKGKAPFVTRVLRVSGTAVLRYFYVYIYIILLLSSPPGGAPDIVTPVSASQPVPLTPGFNHHSSARQPVPLAPGFIDHNFRMDGSPVSRKFSWASSGAASTSENTAYSTGISRKTRK